jgi:LysM repeat protein
MGPASLAALTLSLLGPPAPGGCGDSYTVARHDTLYSIARRCGLGVDAIARANRIDPTRIAAGQRLVLPRPDEAGVKPDEDEGLTYRFRHGDTLYSLARWARVDLRALIAANPCVEPHQIAAGDLIRLPYGAVPPEPARLRERGAPHAAPVPPRVHIAPPPRLMPAPPPHPPHAAPPAPAEKDEGRPDDGPESGQEDDEPEGL